jgi:hypothetical protein
MFHKTFVSIPAYIVNFKPIRERLNVPWNNNISREQNIKNVRDKIRKDLLKTGKYTQEQLK